MFGFGLKPTFAMFSSRGGRDANQDFVGMARAADGSRLYIVCDGLGGHAGGAVAAKLAVDTLKRLASHAFDFTTDTLTAMVQQAHREIFNAAQQSPDLSGMRTTLVVLAIKGDEAIWGHVGDARLYWFRGGNVTFQTKDHSVPQMLYASGEIKYDEIRTHPDRNRLLKSLGGEHTPPRSL